jgi:hypothetical protein
MSNNWIKTVKGRETVWAHTTNPKMTVQLIVLLSNLGKNEYFIFHMHPAPGGHVIIQKPEHTPNEKTAYKKIEMHLKHWNDPKKWKTDPDYGKLTNKP